MADEYVMRVDPKLAEAVQRLYDVLARDPSALGLDWIVTVNRYARPAAAIERTRDSGLRVLYYGDAEALDRDPTDKADSAQERSNDA